MACTSCCCNHWPKQIYKISKKDRVVATRLFSTKNKIASASPAIGANHGCAFGFFKLLFYIFLEETRFLSAFRVILFADAIFLFADKINLNAEVIILFAVKIILLADARFLLAFVIILFTDAIFLFADVKFLLVFAIILLVDASFLLVAEKILLKVVKIIIFQSNKLWLFRIPQY